MENQKKTIELQQEINRKFLEDILKNQKSNDELKIFLSAVFTLGIMVFAKYVL